MSVHTMPPMSMLCEDFLKSMVKSCESKKHHDCYNRSNKEHDDILTTRLNGDLNGYGSETDEEKEEKDNRMEVDPKLTNGFSPLSISSKEIRKDLMRKEEELKRNKKFFDSRVSNQSAALTANEEVESILRKMTSQVLSYDF